MTSDKVHYRGWDIVPFATITADGAWEASCEVERVGPQGLETFQGVSATFTDRDKHQAVTHAIIAAQRMVDDMVADPVQPFTPDERADIRR